MKNYLLLFLLLLPLMMIDLALADIEKGKWNFVNDPDYCYIGSSPVEVDIPEGKQRGDVYILVYRREYFPLISVLSFSKIRIAFQLNTK